MVSFVEDIAHYARVTRGHPDFQVFVQNAEELSVHPDYVQTVSGIGKEDLLLQRQPPPARRRGIARAPGSKSDDEANVGLIVGALIVSDLSSSRHAFFAGCSISRPLSHSLPLATTVR